jgi:hypothetical protein
MAMVVVVDGPAARREPARIIRSLIGLAGTDQRHATAAGTAGAAGGG